MVARRLRRLEQQRPYTLLLVLRRARTLGRLHELLVLKELFVLVREVFAWL